MEQSPSWEAKTSWATQELLLLLLLLTASGYALGGSGTTIHNTILYNTQNNTYTLRTIHNTNITNTVTQNYKHKVST
jgi:hypothetical protein